MRFSRSGLVAAGLVLLALALPTGLARAIPGDAGSTAAEFLRLNAGAAAVAQGEAMTARSGTIHGFRYNPAGIARADYHQLTLQYNSYLSDMSTGHIGGLWAGSRIRAAASVDYWSGGEQVRRTITSPSGSLGTFSNSAMMLALGAAYPLDNGISLGATLKGFEETLDAISRTGIGADIGLHYRRPGSRWELGAAVRNLGAPISFDRDREELPLEFGIGGSVLSWGDRLRVSGEVALPRHQDADWMFGAEFLATPVLPVRIGWNSRNEIGSGLSAGAGFRHNNLSIDYAWTDYSVIGDAHRVALNVDFARPPGAEPAADRQEARSPRERTHVPPPARTRTAEPTTAGKPGEGTPVAAPSGSGSGSTARPVRVPKEPPSPLPPRTAAPVTRGSVSVPRAAPADTPAQAPPTARSAPPAPRPGGGEWRVTGTR